jgi:hypothetical protein
LFVKVRRSDELVPPYGGRAFAVGTAPLVGNASETENATRLQESPGVSGEAISGRIVSKTCTLI